MTTFELSSEIYRNLGYLGNDENYLEKALAMLKQLVVQKQGRKAVVEKNTIQKLRVEDIPLPTDKYVGIFGKDHTEDKSMLEEYLTNKYLSQ